MSEPAERVIWKFTVEPLSPTRMPAGAEILHVHEQNGEIRLWAVVDPSAPVVDRDIEVAPTGGPVPPGEYLGSVHLHDRWQANGGQAEAQLMLVFHLYDAGEQA